MATNKPMQLGMIGLGRMGANLVRRLMRDGHRCVVYTSWAMFAELASQAVPWDAVVIYQVDERVAPPHDPDRNLTHLNKTPGLAPAQVRAMPVDETQVIPDDVTSAVIELLAAHARWSGSSCPDYDAA
jgi:hypothetical protein